MLIEEEKETIDRLYIKAISYSVEAPDYPNTIVFKKDLVRVLNLIEKQQKEIEELKKDNNHQWEERCRLTFELERLQNINKEHQKLNGELREEIEELNISRKNGTLSDGYHTYNDLYYQRCVLFATICNMNKNISWKSARHSDGQKCFDSDNWFIVGIDTLEGSYTYHYEMKFWDMFKVPELEKGKEWDGHTEKDVTRLLSLEEE